MYNLLITGFKTKEEAEEFANWFEGQGEQDITVWLDCRRSEGKNVREYLTVKSIGRWIKDTLRMEIK